MTPPQFCMGNALTLGQGTLASRILGFVRDAAIAALLGSGWMADAFLLSFRIPGTARALLAEGAFAHVLVPAYRSLKGSDPERAWTFVRSMTVALFGIFGLAVIVGALFSDHVTIILAPGFHSMPDVLTVASALMALCLLALPLVSGAAVASSALMAEGRFKPPAYASAVFNSVVILSAGMAFLLFGMGNARAPYALCIGTIAAGMVQWSCQTFFLRRLGFIAYGPLSFKDPVLKQSLLALPRSVFSVGGLHANLMLAALLASFLAEGAISSLYFAERLLGFPIGIVGASIGLASLSDLSNISASFTDKTGEGGHAAASRARFTEHLVTASRITLFFALPAAVGTACLAVPLTSVIFGHGVFDHEALVRTSNALLAYMIGLPALVLARPLLAGMGALGETKASARAALVGFAATGIFGTALLVTGASWAPALAVSLAAWVNLTLLVRALEKLGHSPLPGLVWTLKTLAACAVMAACVLWTANLFSSNPGKAATVPLGIVAYFAATAILRLDESERIVRMILNMIRKTR